jgi:hypothetical protein
LDIYSTSPASVVYGNVANIHARRWSGCEGPGYGECLPSHDTLNRQNPASRHTGSTGAHHDRISVGVYMDLSSSRAILAQDNDARLGGNATVTHRQLRASIVN